MIRSYSRSLTNIFILALALAQISCTKGTSLLNMVQSTMRNTGIFKNVMPSGRLPVQTAVNPVSHDSNNSSPYKPYTLLTMANQPVHIPTINQHIYNFQEGEDVNDYNTQMQRHFKTVPEVMRQNAENLQKNQNSLNEHIKDQYFKIVTDPVSVKNSLMSYPEENKLKERESHTDSSETAKFLNYMQKTNNINNNLITKAIQNSLNGVKKQKFVELSKKIDKNKGISSKLSEEFNGNEFLPKNTYTIQLDIPNPKDISIRKQNLPVTAKEQITALKNIPEQETAVISKIEGPTYVQKVPETNTSLTKTNDQITSLINIAEQETAVISKIEGPTSVQNISKSDTSLTKTNDQNTAITTIPKQETSVVSKIEGPTSVQNISKSDTSLTSTQTIYQTVPTIPNIRSNQIIKIPSQTNTEIIPVQSKVNSFLQINSPEIKEKDKIISTDEKSPKKFALLPNGMNLLKHNPAYLLYQNMFKGLKLDQIESAESSNTSLPSNVKSQKTHPETIQNSQPINNKGEPQPENKTQEKNKIEPSKLIGGRGKKRVSLFGKNGGFKSRNIYIIKKEIINVHITINFDKIVPKEAEDFYNKKQTGMKKEEVATIYEEKSIPKSPTESVYATEQLHFVEKENEKDIFVGGAKTPEEKLLARYYRPFLVKLTDIGEIPLAQAIARVPEPNTPAFKIIPLEHIMESDPSELSRKTLMDLPYYNLVLNIEEECIESLSLDTCSMISLRLMELYKKLTRFEQGKYNLIKEKIGNLIKDDLLIGLHMETLASKDSFEGFLGRSQHMFNRLEYLLYSYKAE
jgi:hypothetical protein